MGANHNKKEFRIMRSVCLWLHEFKCFNCCRYMVSLDVHHINENSADNRLINLMPLCSHCHKLTHKANKLKAISYNRIIVLLLNRVNYFTILKNISK